MAALPIGRVSRLVFIAAWLPILLILLGLVRMLIAVVPFRRLAPILGWPLGPVAVVPILTACQTRRANLIGQAVRAAAHRTPWTSNCFPQAVVARLMLGLYRVPYVLHFGLMPDPQEAGGYAAHAWVVAGKERITGGQGFGQYQVVGAFGAPSTFRPD